MKVLFDTNVILDFLLDRKPFAEEATKLFQNVEDGQLKGYVAAITLNNLFYIIRKLKGREVADDAVRRIIHGMVICKVDRQTFELALQLNFKDFEDAIQMSCALEQELEIIVTRNIQDFSSSEIRILLPKQLTNYLEN